MEFETLNKLDFNIKPNDVFRLLLFFFALILSLHLAGLGLRAVIGKEAAEPITRLFNVANEQNLPTMFSVVVMLLNGVLTGLVGLHQWQEKQAMYLYWFVLSGIFLFLAFDEFAMIHELVGRKMENRFELTGTSKWLSAIPYAIFVAVFFALFLRFLLHIPRATAIRFVVAGVIYVFGVLVLDMIALTIWSGIHTDGTVPIMLFLVTMEEALEMLGMILFVRALLLFVRDNITSEISVRL